MVFFHDIVRGFGQQRMNFCRYRFTQGWLISLEGYQVVPAHFSGDDLCGVLRVSASAVIRTAAPSGISAASWSASTWVISLVPSEALTCAMATASSCSSADNIVTWPFSSVHAPRITFPLLARIHSPFSSFLARAAIRVPVIRSRPAASIMVSTFRMTNMLGHAYRILNQFHLAPSYSSRDWGMSAAWREGHPYVIKRCDQKVIQGSAAVAAQYRFCSVAA